MAYEGNLKTIPGLTAGEDLSAKQFYFATLESDGKADLADSEGEVCIGVIQDADADAENKPVTVAYAGVTKVVASGAITAGARVMCDANGKAKAWAAKKYWSGIALETSSADGDIISMLLTSPSIDEAT